MADVEDAVSVTLGGEKLPPEALLTGVTTMSAATGPDTDTVKLDDATLAARSPIVPDLSAHAQGTGRELFGLFRRHAATAEAGASPLLA